MTLSKAPIPLNLPKWLEENKDKLKPPVSNFLVHNGDVIVMIVGGPNQRTDYHINPTPEWFFQYKGDMILKVVDNGVFKDVVLREGEMLLIPPTMPHNPIRFANTVGIVLEVKRPIGENDRMRWYCENCKEIVHEASFYCVDLGVQVKEAVEAFRDSGDTRVCKNCKVTCDWYHKEGSIQDPNLEPKL